MDDIEKKRLSEMTDELTQKMLNMLEYAPGEAWFWITEAQKRALQSQVSPLIEKPDKAS